MNGTTASYTYDGDDVRISETVGGTTTTSIWDRASGLPLLLDDGSDAYLHAGGVQAQIDGSNSATYALNDALGSVRGQTDGSGTLTGSADYDVFGAPRGTSTVSGPFGYTGEQQDDATGLTYLRARSYQPTTGRFLSADTVQPNAPGTQGYNRYTYTANNPTTWTDPSGHSVNDVAQVQVQIAAVLGGLMALAAVFLAVVAASPGVAFFLGAIFTLEFFIYAVLLILLVVLALVVAADAFDYYTGNAPTDRLSPVAAIDAVLQWPVDPLQECIAGAIGGIRDELIGGIVFGAPGAGDLALGAFMGCFGMGGGPTGGGSMRTQWGWRGQAAWNRAVRIVDEGGTIEAIDGRVATYDEAIALIEDAGGTVIRVEPGHAPGGVSPHVYDHINYVTSTGVRGTIQIQSVP